MPKKFQGRLDQCIDWAMAVILFGLIAYAAFREQLK